MSASRLLEPTPSPPEVDVPPDAARRRPQRWTTTPQLGAALVGVLALHLFAAATIGVSLGFVAVLAPLVGATVAHRCALLAGTSAWQACAVAVLALGSPLAIVASESPGAGLTALIGVGAIVALVGAFEGGRVLLTRGLLVLALSLAALLVGPLTTLPWALGHGWGTGATRLDSGARALTSWPGIDPVMPWLVAAAALGLLGVRGRRALGVAVVLVAAVVSVGDLRAAALVAALPLLALAVVLAAAAAWSGLRRMTKTASGRGHPRAVLAVVLVVVIAALLPAWGLAVRHLPVAGAGTPAGAAARWLVNQVPPGQAVAVDAALYEQLADDADPVQDLVPLTGGATPPKASRVRWVVASQAMRETAGPGTWARRALTQSRSVTAFGKGTQRLDVRSLSSAVTDDPPGARPSGPSSPTTPPRPSTTPSTSPPGATQAPSQAAVQLATNKNIVMSPLALVALTTQPVDDRLVTLLAQLAGSTQLSIVDFPVVAGDDPQVPRRQVIVDAIGGAQVQDAPSSVASLRVVLAAQAAQYRPSADLVGTGSTQTLVITLPPMGDP